MGVGNASQRAFVGAAGEGCGGTPPCVTQASLLGGDSRPGPPSACWAAAGAARRSFRMGASIATFMPLFPGPVTSTHFQGCLPCPDLLAL